MIPVKLQLTNFTSYQSSPVLDFTKLHLAAITGLNGVGKSSLLDAITWAIWGTSRAGDSADELVRLGQTLMSVEFSFELDRHIYTIRRSRKLNSSTTLEFFSNSHNLTEGTIKATQEKIINTLHLTFDTFINSSYIRQGHADEFTTKGPSERKRILSDILGLSEYDRLEEKAKDKAKEAAIKIKLLEYQLLELEAELSLKDTREKEANQARDEVDQKEKALLKLERELKSIEKEKEESSSNLKLLSERSHRLKQAKAEVDNLQTQIESKEKDLRSHLQILSQKEEIEKNYRLLTELNKRKQQLELKRSEMIRLKDELSRILQILNDREAKRKSAISEVQIEIKRIETEIESLLQEINHLKTHKDSCPTCGQIIGQEKNRQIVAKNSREIEKKRAALKLLQDKIAKYLNIVLPEQKLASEKEQGVKILEAETKDYTRILSQLSSLQSYEDSNLKLQQVTSAIEAHQQAINDLRKIYLARQQQIQTDERELTALDKYQIQLQALEVKLTSQLKMKNEVDNSLKELRSRLGAAETLLSRSAQVQKTMEEKLAEKQQLNEEKELFEDLALSLGKKGIQAMIIETVIPEIEEETNLLLERLTEGRMKVTLETQRETKTKLAGGEKGLVETLDIIISDEMGERAYELYSGGEAFRVNLALRLALSKLLTQRAGSKLQFLIIDEGFGTQDAEGIGRIVEALNIIKDDFAKILIITHLDELKEEFDTRVEVSKGPTGSTFKIVGV